MRTKNPKSFFCVSGDSGALSYFRALGLNPTSFGVVDRILNEGHSLTGTILTGSCLNCGVDEVLRAKAVSLAVPCISVVDHWSWYRKRFETSNGLLLPDKILLNDELAFHDAIRDGLPKERLIALGNPVLENLAIKSKEFKRDISKSRNSLGLASDARVIIFISEDLSIFKPGTPDYLGYDEMAIVQTLFDFFIKDSNAQFAIKLHPSESEAKYSSYRERGAKIISQATVDELASAGDIIIGMASMLLLELAMYRDDVISFRPGATKPFIGEKLGATLSSNSIEQLKDVILNCSFVKSSFRASFKGSKERILMFLANYIR